jgi:putative selenate reductase
VLNTAHYVPLATADPRYARAANAKPPRKIGSALELFDCVTCDKCVPVCPNDANFTFVLPRLAVPIVKLAPAGGGFAAREEGTLAIEEQHQIASFADFCNDCGNCDVFCPEDGGPYAVKPRFFGRVDDWRASPALDGFALERAGGVERLFGRIGGRASCIERAGSRTRFAGEGFALELDEASPERDPRGAASVEVDLTDFRILCWIRDAVYGDPLSYPALAAPQP